MAMRSPTGFYVEYNGKLIDYDHAYDVQCVDGFKTGCAYLGVPVQPCPNNWAESYWTCQNPDGSINADIQKWQTEYFDLIDDPDRFRDGDWIVWPRGCASHPLSHIAMYYQGQEFGERQYENNRAFCLKYTDFSDASGALRWKGWGAMNIPEGYSKQTINGHEYTMYRQSEAEKAAVLSAGSGMLRSIAALDADVLITAKLAGANFFQMKEGQADAYGTHYGDEVAPLNGVYSIVPGQDSTMFYNLDTGEYGDSTGYYPGKNENVFSPSLVFPAEGNFQYARMVGVGHANYASMYAVLVRLATGKHIMAITKTALTPKQIYADLKQINFFMNMSVLDGGDSAQMACWHDGAMDYVRKTSRLIPSVVCFYKPKSSETAKDDKDSGTTDYKALYEALQAKYEALQKTNAENLETVTTLKTDYEARIEKAIDILKDVTAG